MVGSRAGVAVVEVVFETALALMLGRLRGIGLDLSLSFGRSLKTLSAATVLEVYWPPESLPRGSTRAAAVLA